MKLIMKVLSLVASSFAVLIISGFLSLQPIDVGPALAQSDPGSTCDDVALTANPADRAATDPVNSPNAPGRVANVGDSGTLDFNLPQDAAYQTCISTSKQSWKPEGQSDAITGYFVNGWAWNTNLGNVSMYCKDGVNGPGASCGAVDYGVVALPKVGLIRGFAWGDNIGWISMGCDVIGGAGTNLGVSCGGVPYGVQIARQAEVGKTLSECGPLQVGDLYGYAWTNNVGWMNFCGAHVDVTPPYSINVSTEISKEVEIGAEAGMGGNDVHANGSDAYNIIVRILDGGVPVDNIDNIAVSIDDIKWTDTLCADQITTHPCVSNGSIKPRPADFAWDAAKKGLVAKVKAIAPTDAATGQQIILNEMTVTVDGFGQVLTPPDLSFDFKPAVEVARVSSGSPDAGAGDQIAVTRNSSEPVYISVAKYPGVALPNNPSIQISSQLHSCDPAFGFIFDDGQIGISTDFSAVGSARLLDANTRAAIDQDRIPCGATPGQTLFDVNDTALGNILNGSDLQGTLTKLIYSFIRPGEEGVAPDSATVNNAIGMRVRVEYRSPLGNLPVRYFAKTVSDGSLLNQSANISGNVRIDVQKALRSDVVAKSLGEAAQSKREPFLKIINGVVRTLTSDSTAATFPLINATIDKLTDVSHPTDKNVLFYAKQAASGAQNPCRVIFPTENGAHAAPKKDFTLLTIGCDVYINKNIYANDADKAAARTGRLGIIALEDLSMPGARKGGNIYICSAVTDITANIVADGSIFSYGKDANDCGNLDADTLVDASDGTPKFSKAPREVLKNQLTIRGSLISNNTYGGAFSTPPLLGDGTPITNPADVYRARLYDLNFLRYASTKPDPDAPRQFCWADDVTLSQTLGQVCAANSPDLRGIANIIYQPPISNMPIFGAVK